jgi:dynein heavy chain
VQKIVTEFLSVKEKIGKICTCISQTPLWNLEPKRIYHLEEFSQAQQICQNSVKSKLIKAHEEVKSILESTYESFKNDGKDIYLQWVRFIEKVDGMIEDSLRMTFKRSLLEISKSINGEGGKARESGIEVHPVFNVNVVLEMQKVDFSPNLQKLEETVNDIARAMINTIAVVPRLAEVLAPESAKKSNKMFDIIANEEDVLKIFLNIQNGMLANASNCHAYLRTWDAYKEIWEINKDAFIRRYAKLKPALSTFDGDISRYSEVANNTQKEETFTNVSFVRLDCSPLKHSLMAHCHAWQNKLTVYLE